MLPFPSLHRAKKPLKKTPAPVRPRYSVDQCAIWLATFFIAAAATAVQWRQYCADLPLGGLSAFNQFGLIWMLLSMTLLLLLPMLLVAHLVMRTGRRRTGWCVFFLGQLVVCMLLIADLRIYRMTNHHLPFYVQFLFKPQLMVMGGGTGSILNQIFEQLRVVLLMLLLIALASYWLARALHRWGRVPHRRRLLYVLPAVYVVGVVGVASLRGEVRCYHQLSGFLPRMPLNLTELGLGPKPPDTAAFNKALNQSLDAIDPDWRAAFAAPRPLDTSARIDRPNPPNVIVLVIDSLRHDMFSPKYMPRLYAHAQKGLVLANHHPGVNGTFMGMFTIAYGRYAMYRPDIFAAGVRPQMPAVFNQSGYHTTYLEGHDDSQYHNMWFYLGPGSGFADTTLRIHGDHWDQADQDILNTIGSMVAKPQKPQFILTLLSSVHDPYFYPPEFEKYQPAFDPAVTPLINMTPEVDRVPLFNRYKNAVWHMDYMLGHFLDQIDLKKNIVVILADHGESFWEDGHVFHAGPMSRIVMNVPCVFFGPGVPRRTITAPTQHVDLLPTLLHLAQGGPVPVKHLQGRDLLADRSPPRAVLLACPPNDDRDSVEFIVLRSQTGMEFSWSNSDQRLEFAAKVSRKGERFLFDTPSEAEAAGWARRIAQVLKPCAN